MFTIPSDVPPVIFQKCFMGQFNRSVSIGHQSVLNDSNLPSIWREGWVRPGCPHTSEVPNDRPARNINERYAASIAPLSTRKYVIFHAQCNLLSLWIKCDADLRVVGH